MTTTHTMSHGQSRRGKIKIKAILLLIIVLAIGASAVRILSGRKASDPPGKRGKPRKDAKRKPKKPAEEELVFIDMGTFLVNLVSVDKLHYLQVAVTIGVAELADPGKKGGHGEKEEKPELSPAADAQIRDTIVDVLSRQSFDDVRTETSRAKLKKQLRESLARLPITCKVRKVLFTSFLMQ